MRVWWFFYFDNNPNNLSGWKVCRIVRKWLPGTSVLTGMLSLQRPAEGWLWRSETIFSPPTFVWNVLKNMLHEQTGESSKVWSTVGSRTLIERTFLLLTSFYYNFFPAEGKAFHWFWLAGTIFLIYIFWVYTHCKEAQIKWKQTEPAGETLSLSNILFTLMKALSETGRPAFFVIATHKQSATWRNNCCSVSEPFLNNFNSIDFFGLLTKPSAF